MKKRKIDPFKSDGSFHFRKGCEDTMILEQIWPAELEIIDNALKEHGLTFEVFEGSGLNATLCRIIKVN